VEGYPGIYYGPGRPNPHKISHAIKCNIGGNT
jgi:hypothetical protein